MRTQRERVGVVQRCCGTARPAAHLVEELPHGVADDGRDRVVAGGGVLFELAVLCVGGTRHAHSGAANEVAQQARVNSGGEPLGAETQQQRGREQRLGVHAQQRSVVRERADRAQQQAAIGEERRDREVCGRGVHEDDVERVERVDLHGSAWCMHAVLARARAPTRPPRTCMRASRVSRMRRSAAPPWMATSGTSDGRKRSTRPNAEQAAAWIVSCVDSVSSCKVRGAVSSAAAGTQEARAHARGRTLRRPCAVPATANCSGQKPCFASILSMALQV
jgi:hypothetical protein